MKHIILFTDSLGSGGAQRQMVGLACMLKERGYDVSVVLYYDKPFYKPQLDKAGIESTVVKATTYLGRIWAFYKYFRKNKGATIIAYQETPSLIACLLRPFIRCSKLIVSERNTTQAISRMDKLRFWLYRFADHIVPNSHSQTNFICKHYPQLEKKVTTITNFVDIDKFSQIEKTKLTESGKIIISVGRVSPQKNLLNYIEAIKILTNDFVDIKVSWFGSQSIQSYYKECVRKVDELGLSNIFTFHLPTESIAEEYKKADIFCLPSIYEGYPNVLCEAMSCGLPVACSNVCDNPYIVKDGINGFLFDPISPEDIATSIKKLIVKCQEDYVGISRLNRQCIIENNSKSFFVEKYIYLINQDNK